MSISVADVVATYFDQFPSREWEVGHILIHADDNPTGVYYLEQGAVRQYAISEKGDEVILNTFKAGAFFPMSWALVGIPNGYFFEVSETALIRFAPTDQVVEFLHTNPDVTLDLLKRMYSGLDAVLSRMTHLLSGTAYERVVNELVLHAKRHTKSSDAKNVVLALKEYELGMYCGLTKETVSREFKKLKVKNLVSVHTGGITVHDLRLLAKELD